MFVQPLIYFLRHDILNYIAQWCEYFNNNFSSNFTEHLTEYLTVYLTKDVTKYIQSIFNYLQYWIYYLKHYKWTCRIISQIISSSIFTYFVTKYDSDYKCVEGFIKYNSSFVFETLNDCILEPSCDSKYHKYVCHYYANNDCTIDIISLNSKDFTYHNSLKEAICVASKNGKVILMTDEYTYNLKFGCDKYLVKFQDTYDGVKIHSVHKIFKTYAKFKSQTEAIDMNGQKLCLNSNKISPTTKYKTLHYIINKIDDGKLYIRSIN